jgi:DNA-binding FadR family transcriptional regulator
MTTKYLNPFLKYLSNRKDEEGCRLPSLSELSKTTETSIPILREQLEVARALGFVEVRPKTGIRKNKYRFAPAVTASLTYAMEEKPDLFDTFADLRKHIEASYFEEAVSILNTEDIDGLVKLVEQAKNKLAKTPAEIPYNEHKELHLLMYSRLNNPFVTGLLEAYWQIYEDVGLTRYTDLSYHQRVWNYHEKIVESIQQGDFSLSKKALLEHMILIQQRPKQQATKNHFE